MVRAWRPASGFRGNRLARRRVLVVDDEKLARERIVRFVEELNLPFDLTLADSGVSALAQIQECTPDLIFLDVQMPGLNGFELLQALEKRPFQVIFQTAFDEYALNAFEESAADYLLKPFTRERFQTAVAKALANINMSAKLELLERELIQKRSFLSRLPVRVGDKVELLDTDKIDCLLSKDHYTFIYLAGAEYISDLSLNHLEERLDPEKFLRTHRSSIVHLSRIKQVRGGANMSLQLLCGLELPVSRQKRQILVERIQA